MTATFSIPFVYFEADGDLVYMNPSMSRLVS